MTNNKNDYPHYDVTYGEQINYVFITLKELIIMQWDYIRKHKLWRVFNNNVENLP